MLSFLAFAIPKYDRMSIIFDPDYNEVIFNPKQSHITVLFNAVKGIIADIFTVHDSTYKYVGSISEKSEIAGYHSGEEEVLMKITSKSADNVSFYAFEDDTTDYTIISNKPHEYLEISPSGNVTFESLSYYGFFYFPIRAPTYDVTVNGLLYHSDLKDKKTEKVENLSGEKSQKANAFVFKSRAEDSGDKFVFRTKNPIENAEYPNEFSMNYKGTKNFFLFNRKSEKVSVSNNDVEKVKEISENMGNKEILKFSGIFSEKAKAEALSLGTNEKENTKKAETRKEKDEKKYKIDEELKQEEIKDEEREEKVVKDDNDRQRQAKQDNPYEKQMKKEGKIAEEDQERQRGAKQPIVEEETQTSDRPRSRIFIIFPIAGTIVLILVILAIIKNRQHHKSRDIELEGQYDGLISNSKIDDLN